MQQPGLPRWKQRLRVRGQGETPVVVRTGEESKKREI